MSTKIQDYSQNVILKDKFNCKKIAEPNSFTGFTFFKNSFKKTDVCSFELTEISKG